MAQTYRSPTGSGPEGSSPNKSDRVAVQPLTFRFSPIWGSFDSECWTLTLLPMSESSHTPSGRTKPETLAAQPYVVLARKYRPQTLDDLIGQDILVRTLRNAFAMDRIAQAYMLTGVRGVGKTTTARIWLAL